MAINKFKFGTKAETLHRLKPFLQESTIPEFLSFSVIDWESDAASVLQNIQDVFSGGPVIVRSSAMAEDQGDSAQAGAFLSVPNVDSLNSDVLTTSIQDVITSYKKYGEQDGNDPENQVLIQEMVVDVAMSGVLFTQDLSNGAPYFVINYDEETGNTDTVTSGQYNNRTLYVYRDMSDSVSSERFTNLLKAVREIENKVGDNCLDIEFALNALSEVMIFQVRRITTQPNWNRGLSLRVIDAVKRNFELLSSRYNFECSHDQPDYAPILGNMPDWNPAEMIGTAPRPLAYSLYRHLITDKVWRVARRQLNYKERVGHPLMLSLSGQPFIDVRESFYSFLPESLPSEIGEKLVRAWLKRLRHNRHLHDKIEFEVAITCYSFDFDSLVVDLIPGVLSDEELLIYKNSLLELTSSHVKGMIASVDEQYLKIEQLVARRKEIARSKNPTDLLTLAHLLEDGIELGTIPFSILARHGFIAVSLLRSLVKVGALTHGELEALQRSIPTIATGFLIDTEKHSSGIMGEEEYLEKYGHLRPGTYDILSLRYDQRELTTNKLGLNTSSVVQNIERSFSLTTKAHEKVGKLLDSHGFNCSVEQLFKYIRLAIQGREYGKFVFTANLSDSLEVIAAWGAQFGLSREELSFVGIQQILDSLTESQGRSIEANLREISEKAAINYQVTTAIRLPSLITEPSDLVIVPLSVDQPNFITRKNTTAQTVFVSGGGNVSAIIDNKIVVIESADPGFDWIFSRPIKGLVTKFGGANSHMAIRCAEFDLPAAIGCGEQIFERVLKSEVIELLCAERQIKFV